MDEKNNEDDQMLRMIPLKSLANLPKSDKDGKKPSKWKRIKKKLFFPSVMIGALVLVIQLNILIFLVILSYID